MRVSTNHKRSESGASSVVYHSTSQAKLISILKSNKIALTPSIGMPAEEAIRPKSAGTFYLSTSRLRRGKYHKDSVSPLTVLLELDGNLLTTNNKAKAVDYHGEEYRKYSKGDYETEDRIFSTKPYIEPASEVITEVSLYYDGDSPSSILNDTRGNYRESFRKLLLLLRKARIPYKIYTRKSDYLLGRKDKAVTLDIKKSFPRKKRDESSKVRYSHSPSKKAYIKNRDEEDFRAKAFLELFWKKKASELSKRTLEFLSSSRLLRGPMEDAIMELGYTLQENRRGDNQANASLVVIVERSGGIKNFLRKIMSKWENKL